MILNFTKYDIIGSLDPVLIYPGLQLHVRLNNQEVHIMGFPNGDHINVELPTPEKAKELFSDIDKFLQYKTNELPEYKL